MGNRLTGIGAGGSYPSSSTSNDASSSTSTQSSTGSTQSGAAVSGSTSSDQDDQSRSSAYGHDKATGLDRADQAAGEHGKQGRDNARMHQER